MVNKSSIFQKLLFLVFPFGITFIIFPNFAIEQNPGTFTYILNEYLFFSELIFLLITFAFFIIIYFFKSSKIINLLTFFFLFLGFYFLIRDFFLPVHSDWTHGFGLRDIVVAKDKIIKDLILIVALSLITATIYFKGHDNLKKFIQYSILGILVFHLVLFNYNLYKNQLFKQQYTKVSEKNEIKSNNKPNIYHLVFDSYGNNFWETLDVINKHDKFKGFVHFPNTFANSEYTKLSVPSFLSSTRPMNLNFKMFKNDEIYDDEKNLFNILKSNGYKIHQYGWKKMYQSADNYYSAFNFYPSDHQLRNLISLITFKITPHFSHKTIIEKNFMFKESRYEKPLPGFLKRIGQKDNNFLTYGAYARAIVGIELMQKAIDEEKNRSDFGNYVFMHTLVPHIPYNVDRSGQITKVETDYYEQSAGTTNIISHYLDVLRELGKYENSIIILQGDHGPVRYKTENFAKYKYKQKLPDEFFKDPMTMFVVKESNSKKKIYQDKRMTQLIDITPTILELAGIENKFKFDGTSVFKSPTEVDLATYKKPRKDTSDELFSLYKLVNDKDWVKVGEVDKNSEKK